MIHRVCLIVVLIVLSFCLPIASLRGATINKTETRDDGANWLVLENDHARLAVWPEAGGAVTQYISKKSNTNFVAGTVVKGKPAYGWIDVTPIESTGETFASLNYQGQFEDGSTFKSIVVTCESHGVRLRREMRLNDDSDELTVIITLTNIADHAQRLWIRWHPYIKLAGDPLAEHSAVFLPDDRSEGVRKIMVGWGWDDFFHVTQGYWLASNFQNGQGLWMTFDKTATPYLSTWTDYKFTRKTEARSYFTAELFPEAILAKPGESTRMLCGYTPFTVEDDAAKMSMGVLKDTAEQAAARTFLQRVKPNFAAIGPYTMSMADNDGANAEKLNRFHFNHRRRDRMGLRDWGFVDAMFAAPSLQNQSIRLRYYTKLFDAQSSPVEMIFRTTLTDEMGRVQREQRKNFTIDPSLSRELDERDAVELKDLPDGWYTIRVEGFVKGDEKPIHTYEEKRRLIQNERAKIASIAASTDPLMERPFVTALRKLELPDAKNAPLTIPIGVEEAGGIARENWPVRVGVPMAQGVMNKSQSLTITAPDGRAIATQNHIMGTWLDGSVKWVMLDFQANTPAHGFAFYHANLGARSDTNVEPIIRDTSEKSNQIIDTGVARWPLQLQPDGSLWGVLRPDQMWWTTADGREHRLCLEGPDAGVQIIENGPMRAVVKATGWYRDDKGHTIAMAEIWAEFYRGQKCFTIHHNVTYTGNPFTDSLGSYGIRLFMGEAKFQSAQSDVDGKPSGTASKALKIEQSGSSLCRVCVDDAAPIMAHRSTGAISLTGKQGNVSLFARDLWRMNPKQISVDVPRGCVEIAYWPASAGAMSFLPREDGYLPSSSSPEAFAVGMSRTHDIVIDPDARFDVTQQEAAFNEPVIAVVPPKYLCATGAMLHLQPYDPDKAHELENLIAVTLQNYITHQELFDWYGEFQFGSMPNLFLAGEYRWTDYARYAHILNEEDIIQVPWLAYLRSGDRRYLKLAISNTRNLLEVATIRWNPVWPEYVGLSRRHHECIWLGSGDYGHSMLDPFLEMYHVTGYAPAWDATLRMAEGMKGVRVGTWRYLSNPIAGLSRMYEETQNSSYKQQADRIWNELCYPDKNEWYMYDHANRMVLYYAPLNEECRKLWYEMAFKNFDIFNGLDVLSAQYLDTHDPKYATAAAKLFMRYQVQAEKNHSGSKDETLKHDPLMRGMGTITQFILVAVREMCYATSTLQDAPPSATQGIDRSPAPDRQRSSE